MALALLSPLLSGHPVLIELAPREQDRPQLEGSAGEASAPPAESLRRPLFTVDTSAGRRTVEGFEVSPDGQVFALLLADSLLGSDWRLVEEELVALRKGLGSRARLELAVAVGDDMRLSGPFRSADQLRAEIRAARPEVSDPEPSAAHPPEAPTAPALGTDDAPPAASAGPGQGETSLEELAEQMQAVLQARGRLYRQIGEAAALLGCDWPAVLVVGRLPSLESDLVLPSAAYLAERMRAHRVRFSFMPLDSSIPRSRRLGELRHGRHHHKGRRGIPSALGK